jgi:hypothetical protein
VALCSAAAAQLARPAPGAAAAAAGATGSTGAFAALDAAAGAFAAAQWAQHFERALPRLADAEMVGPPRYEEMKGPPRDEESACGPAAELDAAPPPLPPRPSRAPAWACLTAGLPRARAARVLAARAVAPLLPAAAAAGGIGSKGSEDAVLEPFHLAVLVDAVLHVFFVPASEDAADAAPPAAAPLPLPAVAAAAPPARPAARAPAAPDAGPTTGMSLLGAVAPSPKAGPLSLDPVAGLTDDQESLYYGLHANCLAALRGCRALAGLRAPALVLLVATPSLPK